MTYIRKAIGIGTVLFLALFMVLAGVLGIMIMPVIIGIGWGLKLFYGSGTNVVNKETK